MSLSFHTAETSHFFTVDVEDYFQVDAFEQAIPRSTWDAQPSRIERNVDSLLALLADAKATGTFFTLGWVADRYPQVVRRIARAGHEVASHGAAHRRVNHMTPGEFRDDVRLAKAALEDATGTVVRGYRAPSFSILPGYEWAFDILLEEGYEYDSSRLPVRRAQGSWNAPRYAHSVQCWSGTLMEFPLTTLDVFGTRISATGGADLRHLPFAVVRQAFRERQREGAPGVLFVNAWELDPDQPRVRAPLFARARHYAGLTKTEPRLRKMLSEFRFTSIADALPEMRRVAPVVNAA